MMIAVACRQFWPPRWGDEDEEDSLLQAKFAQSYGSCKRSCVRCLYGVDEDDVAPDADSSAANYDQLLRSKN